MASRSSALRGPVRRPLRHSLRRPASVRQPPLPRPAAARCRSSSARRWTPCRAAATYLGLSPQALGSDLRSGKTLAAIAKAKGKSVSGLEQAMLAGAKKQLDSAVKAKRLTAAQESKFLKALSSRIDTFVTKGFHFGFGGPMHFGWDGHHRPDHDGSNGPSTAPTAFGL